MTKAQRKAARAAQRKQKKKKGQKHPVAVAVLLKLTQRRALAPDNSNSKQRHAQLAGLRRGRDAYVVRHRGL